jgi:peptide/nickel transport system substrate-binding protein
MSTGDGMLGRRRFLRAVGAGALGAAAGCSVPGGSDGAAAETLYGPDGEAVSLRFVYATGNPAITATMEYIAQRLERVGFDVELNGVEYPTMLSRYAQNTYEGTTALNAGPREEATSTEPWDLMGGIGFNAFPRSPTSIRTFWVNVSERSVAQANFYGYEPSEPLAPKFERAATTPDDDERRATLANVFGVLSRDQPVNFLVFDATVYGFRERVSGLGEPGPSFGFDSQRRYFGSEPERGGTYVSGRKAGAETLNPVRADDTESVARIRLTMDGAYALDNENEFTPRWFTGYEASDDDTRYEFTLREGLEWGGEFGAMTAADWVYYITEVHQAEPNWAGSLNRAPWFRNGEPLTVRETGELSFAVELPNPDPFFVMRPALWGAFCLPRGLVSEYRGAGDGEGLNRDPRVREIAYTGNLGPYSFERWDRSSVFVTSRNDDYYGAGTVFEEGVPYFAERHIQTFGEPSTRLSALRAGDVHSTELPPDAVESFEDRESVSVLRTPTAFCNMLAYNQRANGWGELRKTGVRRALSSAVNKVTVADSVFRGNAAAAYTHQPAYSEWYSDAEVTRYGGPESNGVALARERLRSALPEGYEFR